MFVNVCSPLWKNLDDWFDTGNNGTNVDMNATFNDSGKFGGGFEFDGAGDFISVPDASGLDFLPEFTLSVWFKTLTTGIDRGLMNKLNGFDCTNNNFLLYINTADKVRICTQNNPKNEALTTTLIEANRWYHVVATANATNLTIYLDGILEDIGNKQNATTNTDDILTIGSVSTTAQFFNGTLDEVLIFNRSLSAQEISALYNASTNQYFNNFTSLADGLHTFTGYAVDIAGNKGNTTEFTVTTDTVIPNVTFVSPTPSNNSFYNANAIYVNLSSNDTNDHYSFIDFDGSLVGWWRFDDRNSSNDPTDISSNSNNGSKGGNAAFTTAGKFGGAFEFDGDDDIVEISDSNNVINFSRNYTISLWVNSNIDHSGSLVSKSATFGCCRTELSMVTGSFQNRVRFATVNVESNGETLDTAQGTFFNNVSNHIVAIRNGSTKQIYINGVQKGASTHEGEGFERPTLIFGQLVSDTRNFNGTIDEVMIFNRSLSADEVEALYNATANQSFNNFTSLAEGIHKFTGYTVDIAGNKDETAEFQITTDTVIPNVTFVSPTPVNGSNQSSTSIYVNISSNDTNDHYSFIDFDNSLVGWWRFDDRNSSDDPTDISINSNNGSKQGDAVLTTAGYFGAGFEFDGNRDYVDFTDGPLLQNETNGFSGFAWAKSSSLTTQLRRFFNRGSSQDFYIGVKSGRVICYIRNSTGGLLSVTHFSSPSENEWAHYGCTLEKATKNLTVYVDGVVEASEIESTFDNFNGDGIVKLDMLV